MCSLHVHACMGSSGILAFFTVNILQIIEGQIPAVNAGNPMDFTIVWVCVGNLLFANTKFMAMGKVNL